MPVATVWVSAFIGGSGTTAAGAAALLMSVLVGVGAACVLEVLCGNRWGPVLGSMLALPAIAWGLEHVLLTRVIPLRLSRSPRACWLGDWRETPPRCGGP